MIHLCISVTAVIFFINNCVQIKLYIVPMVSLNNFMERVNKMTDINKQTFDKACQVAQQAIDKYKEEPLYCGFANIVIRPARGKFVSWCKANNIGDKHYHGGWNISYYDFVKGHKWSHVQSMDIKETAMAAVSKYFNEVGINTTWQSRAD